MTSGSLSAGRELLARRGKTKEQRDAGRKPPVYEAVTIPEALGPVDVTVDVEKLKSFAFATDDWLLYEEGVQKANPVISSIVLANDLLQVYYTQYDRHQVVGLHTEEHLEFFSPVRLNETVSITGSYTDKYVRKDRGYVVMEAEARRPDGELLVRHRGVEILRVTPGTVVEQPKERPVDEAGPRVTGISRPDLQPVEVASVELEPGTPIAPITVPVTAERMAVFSFVGEYQRNIHNDLALAKQGGLRAPICQGQQEVCLVSRLMSRYFGNSWSTTGVLDAKFIHPLYAETAVLIGGAVVATDRQKDGTTRQRVEFWIDNGECLAAVGWASALV